MFILVKFETMGYVLGMLKLGQTVYEAFRIASGTSPATLPWDKLTNTQQSIWEHVADHTVRRVVIELLEEKSQRAKVEEEGW
jgi:hypothetical protein